MVFLAGEVAECKVDIAAFADDLVGDDIVRSVFVFACTDFDLLDVFDAGVACGLPYSDDGVEEVVEFLGTGKVVLDDGVVHITLRRVGDDKQRPVVAFLQREEFHHKEAGDISFV